MKKVFTFLNLEYLGNRCRSAANDQLQNNTIALLLDDFNFSGANRLRSQESVLEYWRNNRSTKPELYKLAEVVFAISPAQVTTEWHFSSLGFILNKFRNSLSDESDESLEEIMFMKLNEDVFWNV